MNTFFISIWHLEANVRQKKSVTVYFETFWSEDSGAIWFCVVRFNLKCIFKKFTCHFCYSVRGSELDSVLIGLSYIWTIAELLPIRQFAEVELESLHLSRFASFELQELLYCRSDTVQLCDCYACYSLNLFDQRGKKKRFPWIKYQEVHLSSAATE